MVSNDRMAVFSPPRRSETEPPPMRMTEERMEYRAVSRPAVPELASKNDFQ